MLYARTFAIVLALTGAAFADGHGVVFVNCTKGASLQMAVAGADPGTTLKVVGACKGPITITTDGLNLQGGNSASISAANTNVVTVNGATGITLNGFTIGGGNNGVIVENNSSVSLQSTTISGDALIGLQLLGNSSATIHQFSSTNNGLFGIDVEASSSLIVVGSNTVQGSGVFGIQINNGSSISLTGANLQVTGNTLGIQIGTNAAGFLDGTSVLNTSNNFADGITIVSGSHVVNFGGTITSNANGIHGISLNSKAGLDMDAGSQVTVNLNGADGMHLERESSMTIFNNPTFSGNPGTTTLTSQNNQNTGINVQTNSGLLVSNYAALQVLGNGQAGVALDDGSSLSFTQTIQVNGVQTNITGNHPDLLLTFGSRLSLLANDTIGPAHCDATVLTRGPNAPVCPQ
jgi:hypothetical protein